MLNKLIWLCISQPYTVSYVSYYLNKTEREKDRHLTKPASPPCPHSPPSFSCLFSSSLFSPPPFLLHPLLMLQWTQNTLRAEYRLVLIACGRSQVLTANSAASIGKQESQEANNEGDIFCQPPPLEEMHRGLKRITVVGGLKIESEKDTF